jgi:hypothetical protein
MPVIVRSSRLDHIIPSDRHELDILATDLAHKVQDVLINRLSGHDILHINFYLLSNHETTLTSCKNLGSVCERKSWRHRDVTRKFSQHNVLLLRDFYNGHRLTETVCRRSY